jgi:hypothetical protein
VKSLAEKRKLILQSEEGQLSSRGSELSACRSSRDKGRKSRAYFLGPKKLGRFCRVEKTGPKKQSRKSRPGLLSFKKFLNFFYCCKLQFVILLKPKKPLLCWFFPHWGF